MPELIVTLVEGRETGLGIGALLLAWMAFNVIYRRITGRQFVKPRSVRRAARRRRKFVIWEYKRGG